MKLKIFSPEDKKFRKTLWNYTLIFFLLLPLANKLILGTLTMFIDFYATSYESYFGVLVAQTMSVFTELIDKALIMCGLTVLIYAIHRYSTKFTGKYLICAIVSPIFLFFGALLSVYTLSVAGYHDITPITFKENVFVFFIAWFEGYVVHIILLCVASLVSVVYLSKKKVNRIKRGEKVLQNPPELANKKDTLYSQSVIATTFIYGLILVVTEIISIIQDTLIFEEFSFNFVLETYITPIIILTIRLLIISLAAYLISKLLDKKYKLIFGI